MQEYTIEPLDIKDYDKCSNIWNMKAPIHSSSKIR